MRTGTLLLAILWMASAGASAHKERKTGPDLETLKRRTIRGFTLKKTRVTANGIVELWERRADAVQLRIEIIPHGDATLAAARLKAVNAKIGTQGNQPEELMYRFESSGQTLGWTNYRGTHHITFKTYRYWKLHNGTLVLADVSFPRGKPDFTAARGAFIAAKSAADSTLKAMAMAGTR